MTTSPEDAAAMFDLPPPPPAAPASEASDALEAAEAALAAELAAELASTIDAGGVASDAPDSRTELRVPVSWPARIRLPDGRVIALKVRNVSEGGVGLTSDEPIPACTVVDFETGVPSPDEAGKTTRLEGTIRTTYAVSHGSQILCGGTWVKVPAADLELVNGWIRRLGR